MVWCQSAAYLGNDFLDNLLLALHGEDGLQLAHIDGLPPARRNNLVKGEQDLDSQTGQLRGLLRRTHILAHDTRQHAKCLHVLQNVAGLAGDQHQVVCFQRLVDKPDILRLHKGVLLASLQQAGELGQQQLHALATNGQKVPAHHDGPASRANRRRQQDLSSAEAAPKGPQTRALGNSTDAGHIPLRLHCTPFTAARARGRRFA